jgi:UDP-N-acetylglucosamine--N-acetylmuramyl-(pentapeptide) pyrophosphoryl-undecaprenol N-acetylglucosamine transferase
MQITQQNLKNSTNTFLVGNPINIEKYSKKEAQQILGLERLNLNKPILGVMGGSLGALALNDWVLKHLDELEQSGFQCILISGSKNYPYLAGFENDFFLVLPFVHNMGAFYSLCEAFISRAGASSISELLVFKKPTLFVPYPYATANHQLFNARFACQYIKAFIIEEKDLQRENLKTVIEKLKISDNNGNNAQNQNNQFQEAKNRIMEELRELL